MQMARASGRKLTGKPTNFLSNPTLGRHFLLTQDNLASRTAPVALAGAAQWIEDQPAKQRVAGLIPSGHLPGLWAMSPVGGAREATAH